MTWDPAEIDNPGEPCCTTAMELAQNVDLTALNTLKLQARARWFAEVEGIEDLREALEEARRRSLSVRGMRTTLRAAWRRYGRWPARRYGVTASSHTPFDATPFFQTPR